MFIVHIVRSVPIHPMKEMRDVSMRYVLWLGLLVSQALVSLRPSDHDRDLPLRYPFRFRRGKPPGCPHAILELCLIAWRFAQVS